MVCIFNHEDDKKPVNFSTGFYCKIRFLIQKN